MISSGRNCCRVETFMGGDNSISRLTFWIQFNPVVDDFVNPAIEVLVQVESGCPCSVWAMWQPKTPATRGSLRSGAIRFISHCDWLGWHPADESDILPRASSTPRLRVPMAEIFLAILCRRSRSSCGSASCTHRWRRYQSTLQRLGRDPVQDGTQRRL